MYPSPLPWDERRSRPAHRRRKRVISCDGGAGRPNRGRRRVASRRRGSAEAYIYPPHGPTDKPRSGPLWIWLTKIKPLLRHRVRLREGPSIDRRSESSSASLSHLLCVITLSGPLEGHDWSWRVLLLHLLLLTIPVCALSFVAYRAALNLLPLWSCPSPYPWFIVSCAWKAPRPVGSANLAWVVHPPPYLFF